jgi:hypothetical protein
MAFSATTVQKAARSLKKLLRKIIEQQRRRREYGTPKPDTELRRAESAVLARIANAIPGPLLKYAGASRSDHIQ